MSVAPKSAAGSHANPNDEDPLRLLNQPRVIAEVIGGILLGPTVMMRIPGFKDSMGCLRLSKPFFPFANSGRSHLPD